MTSTPNTVHLILASFLALLAACGDSSPEDGFGGDGTDGGTMTVDPTWDETGASTGSPGPM